MENECYNCANCRRWIVNEAAVGYWCELMPNERYSALADLYNDCILNRWEKILKEVREKYENNC